MITKSDMELLMTLGDHEKTDSSRYQIMIMDNRDRSIHPLHRPKVNRFFDSKHQRDTFFYTLGKMIIGAGGSIAYHEKGSHPEFLSYKAIDSAGNINFDITVYR